MSLQLSPSQQRALDKLLDEAHPGRVVALAAGPGLGKTTVLREAHARLGGSILGAADMQRAAGEAAHPLALEDAFYALIGDALDRNTVVLLDDMHLLSAVVEGCHMYPRGGFINVALTALSTRLSTTGGTLVVANSYGSPVLWALAGRAVIADFEPEDYRTICGAYLSADVLAR